MSEMPVPLPRRFPVAPPTTQENDSYVMMSPHYVNTIEAAGHTPPPLPPKPQKPLQAPALQHAFSHPPQPRLESTPMPVGTGAYQFIQDPKDLEISKLRANVRDLESQLRQRSRELEQCNTELTKLRHGIYEKKEVIKRKDELISSLQHQLTYKEQQTLPNEPPQVAGSSNALQFEIQHLRKAMEDMRVKNEELKRTRATPQHPPVHRQEVEQLRGQLQWCENERQKLTTEVQRLHSSEQLLSVQANTYHEDFLSERKDREKANERYIEMKEQHDTMAQILTAMNPEQAAQEGIQLPHDLRPHVQPHPNP